jgi:hypothetical protein
MGTELNRRDHSSGPYPSSCPAGGRRSNGKESSSTAAGEAESRIKTPEDAERFFYDRCFPATGRILSDLLIERRNLTEKSVNALLNRARYRKDYLGRSAILVPYLGFVNQKFMGAQAFSICEQPFIANGKKSKRRFLTGSRVSDDGFVLIGDPAETADRIFIVEGLWNGLSWFETIENSCVVVAGSAVSVSKLHHFRPYANRIILAFDGDEAGRTATRKAVGILGRSVRVIDWAKTGPLL